MSGWTRFISQQLNDPRWVMLPIFTEKKLFFFRFGAGIAIAAFIARERSRVKRERERERREPSKNRCSLFARVTRRGRQTRVRFRNVKSPSLAITSLSSLFFADSRTIRLRFRCRYRCHYANNGGLDNDRCRASRFCAGLWDEYSRHVESNNFIRPREAAETHLKSA